VVDHQTLTARSLSRDLDRARCIRVAGRPVVNGKGDSQRRRDNNAAANDDLSGAIFHRPTPIKKKRKCSIATNGNQRLKSRDLAGFGGRAFTGAARLDRHFDG